MYVFGNVYMSVGTHKGRKRVSGSLKLELQVIVSQWIWELETKQILKNSTFSWQLGRLSRLWPLHLD